VQLGGIGGYHDVAGLSRPVGGEVPLDGHGPAGGTQLEKLVFLGAGGTGAGVLVDVGDLDAGVSRLALGAAGLWLLHGVFNGVSRTSS
jgi:hypothetical protein